MKIQDVQDINPDKFDKVNQKALKWVLKGVNFKELTKTFKSQFPKSPYSLVVQLPTVKKDAFLLFDNEGELRRVTKVCYIPFSYLKKLGCTVD